jgi:copper homeostasis protein
VIIRPRGGDFLFDDDEFATMQADIDTARDEGADGVVIGLLTADGAVDARRTRDLIARARPLAVTFHRAFDMTPDPFEALETLVGLGVDRVLTSGQEASVLEGLPLIAELVRKADGVSSSCRRRRQRNAADRRRRKPAEMHFAAGTGGQRHEIRRAHVHGGELRPPEHDRLATSADTVCSVMAKVWVMGHPTNGPALQLSMEAKQEQPWQSQKIRYNRNRSALAAKIRRRTYRRSRMPSPARGA